MSIWSPTSQRLGSWALKGLRGAFMAPVTNTSEALKTIGNAGSALWNSAKGTHHNTGMGTSTPATYGDTAKTALSLIMPSATGLGQSIGQTIKDVKSIGGTPSSSSSKFGTGNKGKSSTKVFPSASTSANQAAVSSALPSLSSQGQYDPAREQLLAEQAMTQSGNARGASALSDAYTGKGSTYNAAIASSPTSAQAAQPKTSASPFESILSDLRSKVQSLSTPSSEETKLQDELSALNESTGLGISGLEGQGRGIPLSLVRGEQSKLQEQANIKAQTLTERIAALAQQRQAKLQAAQNAYTQAQDQQSRYDQLTAPTNVGGNILQFDPATGTYKTLYSAPAQASESPTSVQEYQFAAQSGYPGSYADFLAMKNAGSTGGAYTLSPGQMRFDQSGNLIASAPASSALPASANEKIADSNTLLQQIGSVLGMVQNGRIPGIGLVQGRLPDYMLSQQGQQARFALNNILASFAKVRGGTSFTDSEKAMLEGYIPKASDSDSVVVNKLNSLKQYLQSSISSIQNQYGGYSSQQFTPEEMQYLQSQGYSFPNALSTAQNGSAAQIAAAIRQVESGGNYNARGGSGEIGAYQFMPSSWKSWAGKYLGNANAPMTQQNQDKVAQAKIQDLLNQGYNPQQVALIWNGGEPVVKKGVNRYGVAYDSGAYANKVLNALRTV